GDRGGRGGRGGRYSDRGSPQPTPADRTVPLPFNPPQEGEQDGHQAAAKPVPALREGKVEVPVISNEWPLLFEDRVVYRYSVVVGLVAMGNDESQTRVCDLTKGRKNDIEREELIRESIRVALKGYKVLSRSGYAGFDGATQLFANESMDDALNNHQYNLLISVDELPEDTRKIVRGANARHIVIEVQASGSFNLKDFSGLTSTNLSTADLSVKQFLETITSEDAIKKKKFTFFSGGKLYRTEKSAVTAAGPGQERRAGINKGVALATVDDEISTAVVIDSTRGTFWKAGALLDTICQINGWRNANQAIWNKQSIKETNRLIKNLRLGYTNPSNKASFDVIAYSITASYLTTDGKTVEEVRRVEQLTYKTDKGVEMPLFDLFKERGLKYMKWPLVESRRARRRTDGSNEFDVSIQYFPVELLTVKADQRVPLDKQLAQAEPPVSVEKRWAETTTCLKALNLFGEPANEENQIMAAFGVRVSKEPLKTTAIQRRVPDVEFQKPSFVERDTSFKTGFVKYLKPAILDCLYFGFTEDCRCDRELFVNSIVDAARKKGMVIKRTHSDTVTPTALRKYLSNLSKSRKGENIVFIYVEPEKGKTHDLLKLCERQSYIVTQHFKELNATKLCDPSARSTMENVLLKLNVKAGGQNYSVKPEKFANPLWTDKKTMIMSYDVWHSTGQSKVDKMRNLLPEPSVVGFSFNGGPNPDGFIGDYHYQETRRERVNDNVLNARIKWMLALFEKKRGELPPLIIVVRDGISDGQYQYGMDELDALREGAAEYAVSKERADNLEKKPLSGYAPKFIFVVATKNHHKRMHTETKLANGKVVFGNPPPMTVVDDVVVSPILLQFYLQSHTPVHRECTAKGTLYTVLKDDLGTTNDAMQSLMGALCMEHQVSNKAISIPEPVYQSDEWAKRGAANMRLFRDMFGDGRGNFKAGTTFDSLTKSLAYWNTPLEHIRTNA
ncbi:hypothetical protein PFISCL1PPCAC_16030, partial [Pristionchus fissidentatus]